MTGNTKSDVFDSGSSRHNRSVARSSKQLGIVLSRGRQKRQGVGDRTIGGRTVGGEAVGRQVATGQDKSQGQGQSQDESQDKRQGQGQSQDESQGQGQSQGKSQGQGKSEDSSRKLAKSPSGHNGQLQGEIYTHVTTVAVDYASKCPELTQTESIIILIEFTVPPNVHPPIFTDVELAFSTYLACTTDYINSLYPLCRCSNVIALKYSSCDHYLIHC